VGGLAGVEAAPYTRPAPRLGPAPRDHAQELSGAEALGWADEVGSLDAGKSADLVVLPLPSRVDADPHRLVLDSDRPVARVLYLGRWREAEPRP
jgi:cytosine/adenosine deaminase-related metal-dependent hydrolase